jgi:hypothetical protein
VVELVHRPRASRFLAKTVRLSEHGDFRRLSGLRVRRAASTANASVSGATSSGSTAITASWTGLVRKAAPSVSVV